MNAGPVVRLALTEGQLALLSGAAVAAYPKEFCALLIGFEGPAGDGIGKVARVTRIVLADNVDAHPESGFELDPKVLVHELRALREAERAGQEDGERLLGHAHSHPDAPASPSKRDLAQVVEFDLVWLIVPVKDGRAGPPRAFQAAMDALGKPMFSPISLVSASFGAGPSEGPDGRQETA